MNKLLWMNSGGKDSVYVILNFLKENPNIEFASYLLETDFIKANIMADEISKKLNLELIKIPYRDTRYLIRGLNSTATVYWSMECHLRAVQYALANGYDTILSGGTNVHVRYKNNDDAIIEDLMNEMQDLLEVPQDKRVTLLRPVKGMLDRDIKKQMVDDFDKANQ